MQLYLVLALCAITWAVCDASFVNITAWRNTIKHPKTKRGKTHTLDLYNRPAKDCTPHPMTESERRLVVKIHNDFRRKVAKGQENRGHPGPQPKAENMLRMQYDKNLEKVAMAWISQCKPGHDGLRDIEGFTFVGQNVLMEGSTAPLKTIDWERLIRKIWYDEVKDFNGRDAVTRYMGRNPQSQGEVGHYAQLVNAKAKRVGCAQATHRNGKWYTRRIACNYGEGVIIDAALYYEGKPCSNVDNKRCDDGLVIG